MDFRKAILLIMGFIWIKVIYFYFVFLWKINLWKHIDNPCGILTLQLHWEDSSVILVSSYSQFSVYREEHLTQLWTTMILLNFEQPSDISQHQRKISPSFISSYFLFYFVNSSTVNTRIVIVLLSKFSLIMLKLKRMCVIHEKQSRDRVDAYFIPLSLSREIFCTNIAWNFVDQWLHKYLTS